MSGLLGLLFALSTIMIMIAGFLFVFSDSPYQTEKAHVVLALGGIGVFFSLFFHVAFGELILAPEEERKITSSPEIAHDTARGFSNSITTGGNNWNIFVKTSTIHEENGEYYCEIMDATSGALFYSASTTKPKAESLCTTYPEGMNQEIYFEEKNGIYILIETRNNL